MKPYALNAIPLLVLTAALANASSYAQDVRAVDADTPARFNADPSRLFEASGSAGKVCLFAVRLDTFPKEPSTVFYIGSNTPDDLTAVRRHLLRPPRLTHGAPA